MKKIYLSYLFFFCLMGLKAQVTNQGDSITVEPGGLLYIGGDYTHANGTILNKGKITIGGDYTHENGTILNKGKITIGGNWENKSVSNKVFDQASTGWVQFAGDASKIQKIGGDKATQFPNLAFSTNDGKIQLEQNAEARDSLNIGSTEVFTKDKELKLLNPDSKTFIFKFKAGKEKESGVINTKGGGAFVRATNKKNAPYLFPLGSKPSGSTSFSGIYLVFLTPVNPTANTYTLSMIQENPDQSKLFRTSKSPDIDIINDKYYYQIKSSNHGSSLADITFFTKLSEDFSWIVSWEFDTWKKSPNFKKDKRPSWVFELKQVELTHDFKQFTLATTTDDNPIEIYNAFSPNGDGKNDTWAIKNIDYYPDNDLQIYDRSGNLVYKCSGYASAKNWDGQNNSPGSYYYILRVKIAGEDKYYKGSVTLIKN